MGNGDGTFQTPVGYVSGQGNSQIVAGDFSGNGILDLAVESAYSGTVSILMGNGDGTFQPPVNYAVGSYPTAIVAGDFSGNGILDLAVADYQGRVSCSWATVTGRSSRPGQLWRDPADLRSRRDFSGNGIPDLAVLSETGYTLSSESTISILMGNGDGTFSAPGQSDITPTANPLVADVNGDGTDDVLVVDGAGDILYRQGIPGQPGTFEPPVDRQPRRIPSRDIAWVPNTTDGPLLASVDAHDDAVSLYAYRNGAFVRVGSLATGQLPAQIIAADLNGTGWTTWSSATLATARFRSTSTPATTSSGPRSSDRRHRNPALRLSGHASRRHRRFRRASRRYDAATAGSIWSSPTS